MSKATQLAKAGERMRLAYIDWQDNQSSKHFENAFFKAQTEYRKLKSA